LSPEEIVKTINDFNDPANEKVLSVRAERADKILKDTYEGDPAKMLDATDSIFTWQTDTAPMNQGMADLFSSEWTSVFKQSYIETGDEDKAVQLTQTRLSRVWAQSELGGGGVMRHAPEKYYDLIDGSKDWMKESLEAELTDLGFKVKPEKAN
jgi:hypothetical protein